MCGECGNKNTSSPIPIFILSGPGMRLHTALYTSHSCCRKWNRMREWEGDASLSRIVAGHCQQLLLLRQGWHCPLLVICHLRIERERERDREGGSDSDVKPTGPNKHPCYAHMEGDDIEPMTRIWAWCLYTSCFINKLLLESGHQPWTIWLVQIATMLDTGLEGNDIEPTWRQGYGPGAYIRLASETSYYWSRSPTLVTMEPFANSYHAGYSPGGRWYWITTRIWASIRVWIPLPPSPYHTHTHADVQIIIHMYDNIRMISTIAFCVLLSSFSSFLAISRLRSLNKEDDENIILLITYDMQRQKGKA